MTKTAFLFAGQGAQYLGMGRDLYDHYPIVKETIDQASQVLGYDLRYLIDTEEAKLNQTRYTQPAILATSVAIYRLLKEKGYQPDMVAGLSLGEYSALVASGPWTLRMQLPWLLSAVLIWKRLHLQALGRWLRFSILQLK